jgi:hypothetical protein
MIVAEASTSSFPALRLTGNPGDDGLPEDGLLNN